MEGGLNFTCIRAETLTPFAYHSLPVPSGTATLPDLIGDRAIAFALAATLGALRASPIMPAKDYKNHLNSLPLLASVFEATDPSLLRPLACRYNLDTEGGMPKRIMDATGTGNLKTYYFIQEVPPRSIYHGVVFGPDPFNLAEQAEGAAVNELIVRVGLRRAGMLRLTRADVPRIRLNAHTARLLGAADLDVERYAMHDLQVTGPIPPADAAKIVRHWRRFPSVT